MALGISYPHGNEDTADVPCLDDRLGDLLAISSGQRYESIPVSLLADVGK